MTHRSSLLLLLVSTACGPRKSPPPPGSLAIADTLLAPSNPQSGGLTDLAIGADGLAYITDGAQATVLVVDSTGTVVRQIGRRGAGPGEMQQPRNVSAQGDTIRVGDAGGDQVHVFTHEGQYVRSVHGYWGLAIADVAFGKDGSSLAAQHGRNGVPAIRIGPDGASGPALGHTDHPLQLGFDFRAIKQQLKDGQIPEALLTYTGPALAPDGSAWVLHLVAGRVDRFSATDSLLWSVSLSDTLIARLRNGLFEQTRRDTTPRFAFPNVLSVARPVGDTLWVLLRGEGAGVTTIARLAPNGTWITPIQVAGTGDIASFAVDRQNGRLLWLDRSEGTVVSVVLGP